MGSTTKQPKQTEVIEEKKSTEKKTIMGIDTDLVAVLQDLVEFLENLSDVKLPNDLQNVRDNLLRRSRTSLVAVGQRSTTPEPYLDMNAGKGKGLHLETIDACRVVNDNQITEYMYADNSNQSRLSSCQDYYESFSANVVTNPGENTIERELNNAEEELKSIYRTFSYVQTISKAAKSGPLNLKEERRIFGFQFFGGFDQYRSCFVGLVGTHLLLYATKHDKQPSDIISIRGYSARASPNAIPRDSERSKSAFEIFSPGNRTFQFSARSPKEMEQWVAIICRAGNATSSLANTESIMITPRVINETPKSVVSMHSTCSEEQYQDVSCINDGGKRESKITDNGTNNENENGVMLRNEEKFTSFMSTHGLVDPPPLPARIPRRLPSLPHEQQPLKLDAIDDGYDEDDIYHKIEDVKQLASTYQNLTAVNHVSNIENDRTESKRKAKKSTKSKRNNDKLISLPPGELYDDAQPVEVPKVYKNENERMSMTYDDIQIIVNDARKEIVKETRKKSFLDRVRYKKESPKKEDAKKKLKREKSKLNKNILQPQCEPTHETTSYDDVFDLGINRRQNNENLGDYTCPPAPRSIYEKPVSVIVLDDQNNGEDFYDDIGVFQNNKDDKFRNSPSQVSTFKPSCLINDNDSSRLPVNSLQMATTMTNCQDECEHYQVPRSQDPIDIGGQVEVAASMAEELYDDIAIVANFRARKRDSACSNSSSKDKIPNATTNVVRVWNRFASGRKLKTNDSPSVDSTERVNCDEYVNTAAMKVDSNEGIDGSKMNKLQVLINKMESSLSKSKSIPATINKSHDENFH